MEWASRRVLRAVVFSLLLGGAGLVASILPSEDGAGRDEAGGVQAAESGCLFGAAPYLGIHDGWVAVFDGRRGLCREPESLTPLRVEDLAAPHRRELSTGIPFEDEDELFLLLEGLERRQPNL